MNHKCKCVEMPEKLFQPEVKIKPHLEKGNLTACRVCGYFGTGRASFIIDQVDGQICETCIENVRTYNESDIERLMKPFQWEMLDDYEDIPIDRETSVKLPCGGTFSKIT